MPDVQLIGFMRLAPPFGRAAVFTDYLRSQDLSSLSQIQDGGLSCRSRSTFQDRLMSFDWKNRLPHLQNFGFTCRDYCANEMIGSHFDVLILLFPVIVQHNCSLLLTLGCMVSLWEILAKAKLLPLHSGSYNRLTEEHLFRIFNLTSVMCLFNSFIKVLAPLKSELHTDSSDPSKVFLFWFTS